MDTRQSVMPNLVCKCPRHNLLQGQSRQQQAEGFVESSHCYPSPKHMVNMVMCGIFAKLFQERRGSREISRLTNFLDFKPEVSFPVLAKTENILE